MKDNRPILTILTDPIPDEAYSIYMFIKKTAIILRDLLKPKPVYLRSKYRGHFAVTRSLVEGLQKANIRFNYNPSSYEEVADTVVVLSGVNTLRQVIKLKQCGKIKKVLAGPNIIDFPSDSKAVICSSEVDFCLTPCKLTSQLYLQDCPQLAGRLREWPSGVDIDYWHPLYDNSALSPKKKVLFYDKQIHGKIVDINSYIDYVSARGFEPIVIKYGSYSKEMYLELLQQSSLMIGFSHSESQGLAWAESWSTNVPTLIWYVNEATYNHPRALDRFFEASSAPYLNDETGIFFRSFEDFTKIFEKWHLGKLCFSPRNWVELNMSDEVCSRKLIEIAGLN